MMNLVQSTPTTPAEIANLSTQTLRAELAKALTVSARTLQHLALIWRELESRGEDLSDLRTGLATYLPLIASGQLDAEVVVRFAGNKTLLQSVGRLPLDEQRRLATGGSVGVITVAADGHATVRQVPAYALTATQARLVFDDGRIRRPEEQQANLDSRSLRGRLAPAPRQVVVDRQTGTLKIGRHTVALGDVFAAIAALDGPDTADETERTKTIMIQLTEEEHRRFKIRVAEAKTTQQAFVRLALRKIGAI